MSYRMYSSNEINIINGYFLLRSNLINKNSHLNFLLTSNSRSFIFENLNFREILRNRNTFKIYAKKDLDEKFFEKVYNIYDWHYGYVNKTHYLLNGLNEIIGCLNLIFLSIFDNTYLFYFDTIEIKKAFQRQGLGTKLVHFIIESEIKKYRKFSIFLLVAKCEQNKLKFFNSLGFVPIKLRKTKTGTHCILTYPFNENSELNCQRMFEYFNWREEKKEFISSDCKFALNPNPTGLYWCAKKNIYVTGLEKQNCTLYIKEKEIFNEKKFLTFKHLLKQETK